ncbi:hypothetical protein D3C84_1056060 [compost metagenome]
MFRARAKRITRQSGTNDVDAFISKLNHHITDVIDPVSIIASTADHPIGAHAAIQGVVTETAD